MRILRHHCRVGTRSAIKERDRFLAELEAVYARGYRGQVSVVDDKPHWQWARRLAGCWAAPRSGTKPWESLHYFCEASTNLADDPALLKALVDARFILVFVGVRPRRWRPQGNPKISKHPRITLRPGEDPAERRNQGDGDLSFDSTTMVLILVENKSVYRGVCGSQRLHQPLSGLAGHPLF